MQSASTLARAFAHPWESWSERFFGLSTRGWAQEIVRHVVDRIAAGGLKAAEDTKVYLRRFRDDGVPAAISMDPVFGAAADLLTGASQSGEALAALCLVLSSTGHPGRWSTSMRSKRRLRFGRVLLPTTRELAVQVSAAETLVQGGDRFRYRFAADGTVLSGGRPDLIPRLTLKGLDMICWNADVRQAYDLEPVPRRFRRLMNGSPLTAARNALALLQRHASKYSAWVARVAHVLVLQASRAGLLESGSFPNRPGLIRLSADDRSVAVAEMFVHEASHQYFYILSRLGELLQGKSRLVYSPLKGRPRPLSFILLGFHAFANVLLLHGEFRKARVASDFVDLSYARTLRDVTIMRDALAKHASFTPLGRALFEPLNQRVLG